MFSKITIFAKFSKNHVLSFLLMSGLCAINSIQWLFDFWQCYTHITEGTLHQNSLIYRKLKWQKLPFGGSFQIFINTSTCKPSNWINCLALTSHKIVYSINEEKISLFEKYAFWGKKSIFGNSRISPNLLDGFRYHHWLFGSRLYCLVAHVYKKWSQRVLDDRHYFEFWKV